MKASPHPMSLSNPPTISAPAPSRESVGGWVRSRSRLAVSFFSFVLVVLIGAANGGYFPTSWGWCTLAFTWIAGLSLIFAERVRLSRLELAFIGALALLTAWTALSIIWSSDPESSVLQVQRALVYLSAATAMVLVVRAAAVAHLLAGLLAGVAWLSAQALTDRLFPDVPAGVETIFQDRLTGAISYSNALGLVAVMGALLALAMAVHARRLPARVAGACTLPLLLTTAYFTFSRGAWVALAIGLLVAIAVDGPRLKLVTTGALVVAPALAAVWLASRAPALTSSTASTAGIAEEGPELAIRLVALTLASGVLALALGALERRVRVPTVMRRGYAALLAAAALALVGGFVIDRGGPVELVTKTYQAINKDQLPATQAEGNDLNTRLASIGTSPRVNFWRVALRQHEEHPWIGSGAGTYAQFWDRNRRVTEDATDGHSLYLETLAELGWPGLILVLALLAAPLAAVRRARRRPLVAGAAGAYAAFLFHAGIDWDWEVPSVTLLALACAVALMAAARDGGGAVRWELGARWRSAGLAASVALALFAFVGLIGNRALADAQLEASLGDQRSAKAAAQVAVRWAPWSALAHHELGRAEARLGRVQAGRREMRKAVEMSPDDWRIWYDIGILSRGDQRRRAFVRAATLNPLQGEITALRTAGYNLPPAPNLQ